MREQLLVMPSPSPHSREICKLTVKQVWHTVHKAQSAAIAAMTAEASGASVDIAARTVIEEAGYGKYFTHRLGHGIGIQSESSTPRSATLSCGISAPQSTFARILTLFHLPCVVHESPYLNKGNVDTPLKPGMLFTAEPGVYMWDKLGVRLEDVMLVREDGEAECLSCGFGGSRATSPWDV